MRKKVYEAYTQRLQDVQGLTLLQFVNGIKQNYAYYPVLVDKEKFGISRDELCEKLARHNIYARKYFYPLVSENKEFAKINIQATPCAECFSKNILCLPMYAHLDLKDVARICDIIRSENG